MSAAARLADHPLFACAFRPLFLATSVYAAAGLALWMAALFSGLVLPAVPGGILAWHAHELLFGVGLAAVAGFVLTAIPEFTGTPAFGPRAALFVAAAWLVARIAFWLSGAIGPWPAALANGGLAALLPVWLGPRLLRDPGARQLGFFAGLAAFAIAAVGFHADVLRGADPMRWVHAGIGVMMALIVVAMSRISMRIVNEALDAARAAALDPARAAAVGPGLRAAAREDLPEYRARPPRRNLAIFTIAVHAASELALPNSALGGWIALAAAAAVLNLLNDWHVGRPLFGRWPTMLYAVYWLMAAGYATMGFSLLGAPVAASAGRHLLTVGAMGLSIFAVLCIAGRIHAGRPLDDRRWTPLGATLLVFAALARAGAGAGVSSAAASALIAASAIAWIGAFALVVRHLGPVWCSARNDGGTGCEEWIDPAAANHPAATSRVHGCQSGAVPDSSFSTSSSSTWGNAR